MDKKIAKLSAGKHFSVDLADRPLSIFVDGDSGIIFFDEGAGPGRVGGGVLTPEGKPRFVVRATSPNISTVEIEFRGRRLELGRCDHDTLLQRDGLETVKIEKMVDGVSEWVEQVNALLLSKFSECENSTHHENEPKPADKVLASAANGEPEAHIRAR